MAERIPEALLTDVRDSNNLKKEKRARLRKIGLKTEIEVNLILRMPLRLKVSAGSLPSSR